MQRLRTNGDGQPVVALDIDGTLGDYHRHFLWFAEMWLGKKMPDPMDINPGMRLHSFMGVSLARYRDCKLAFRQGGLKRFMPAYDGAAELTDRIRRAHAEVWICTTRPYLRLDNIDPDTREWLRRNKIKYDAVLFGEDKYKELRRQAAGRVAAIVDDLPEMYDQAAKEFSWSPPERPTALILRTQPYNLHRSPSHRATTLQEAWSLVSWALDRWRNPDRF